MKLALAAAVLAVASPALAQHAGHDHAPAAAPGAVKGTGIVKGVDAKAGVIKIHHGPIPALKWPAMTMDFKASPQVIAAAKTGKTVTFTLDSSGKEVLALQ